MVAFLSAITEVGIGCSSSICDRVPNWGGEERLELDGGSSGAGVEQSGEVGPKHPKVSGRGRLE
jgi:hypothetical protein